MKSRNEWLKKTEINGENCDKSFKQAAGLTAKDN